MGFLHWGKGYTKDQILRNSASAMLLDPTRHRRNRAIGGESRHAVS
jgi:hypothetical protein